MRKIIGGVLRGLKDSIAQLYLGDLSIARDWGWAEDYVQGIQLITRSDRLSNQVACTGRMVTLEYFVDRIFSILGLNWRDRVAQDKSLTRPCDILCSVGNPEPRAKAYDWLATYDVDQPINRLVEFSSRTQIDGFC